jgi:hypothetical protein
MKSAACANLVWRTIGSTSASGRLLLGMNERRYRVWTTQCIHSWKKSGSGNPSASNDRVGWP